MPRFALSFPHVEYEINPGDRLLVLRPTIRIEVVGLIGEPTCFIDTGAPLSVVSFGLACQLPWVPIPVSPGPFPRYVNGAPSAPASAAELLVWDGLPATFGTADVSLRNLRTGAVTGPLTLRAKFLQTPSRHFADLFVLLGMSFLADNGGSLQLAAGPFAASGHLDLP